MRNIKKSKKNNDYVGGPTESQLKAQAWKELKAIYGLTSTRGMVLHHVDPTLKARDPERYSQWNAKDLIPMPKAQHRSFHMKIEAKGRKHTETHNGKISKTLKEHNLKGKAVLITLPAQAYVFKTLAQAAKFIGCSKQLVSQCLRPNQPNQRAKGWKIQLLGIERKI